MPSCRRLGLRVATVDEIKQSPLSYHRQLLQEGDFDVIWATTPSRIHVIKRIIEVFHGKLLGDDRCICLSDPLGTIQVCPVSTPVSILLPSTRPLAISVLTNHLALLLFGHSSPPGGQRACLHFTASIHCPGYFPQSCITCLKLQLTH